MHWAFRCAYPWIVYGGIPLLILWAYLLKKNKKQGYFYPLASVVQDVAGHSRLSEMILSVIHWSIVTLMLIALARPQWVDVTSHINVEGIDIMMVLDVSGSMQFFDDIKDRRPRVEVAKREAINFIEKRVDDQIGLVLFAHDAVVRCPLTNDTKLLTSIINDIELGVINADGTVLSRAIVMGAQRLKKSTAQSKIMILLTDGEPTPGLDIHPKDAVTIAQKLGIKLYTIGIGSDEGGFYEDPLFGTRRMNFRINKQLLNALAESTGGKFFEARKPDDLKRIYQTIDQLEKTEHEADVYTQYDDMFPSFLWIIFGLMMLLIVLKNVIWLCI